MACVVASHRRCTERQRFNAQTPPPDLWRGRGLRLRPGAFQALCLGVSEDQGRPPPEFIRHVQAVGRQAARWQQPRKSRFGMAKIRASLFSHRPPGNKAIQKRPLPGPKVPVGANGWDPVAPPPRAATRTLGTSRKASGIRGRCAHQPAQDRADGLETGKPPCNCRTGSATTVHHQNKWSPGRGFREARVPGVAASLIP